MDFIPFLALRMGFYSSVFDMSNVECKVSILLAAPFDSSFTYTSDVFLAPGTVVEVPFGASNKKIVGIVVDDEINSEIDCLKPVIRCFDLVLSKKNLNFLMWVSRYTTISRGNVLRMVLCEKTVFSYKKEIQSKEMDVIFSDITLNEHQKTALEIIKNSDNRPCLLHGVTGSGKTEVYLSMAQEYLKNKQQVLILLPEISLTNQFASRIKQYFGAPPFIWHSGISAKERRSIWKSAASGKTLAIIGTRSALFIPFQNLGLIIVDEEHDTSYKQEEGGFYNARDMAIVLAKTFNAKVILSSATPSIETYNNCQEKKYAYAAINHRFGGSSMPKIELIDMRQNKFDGFISYSLLTDIKNTLAAEDQALIYLNRRGYAPITLCKECGEKLQCPNCTSWLVHHKNNDRLSCHYCSHSISIPNKCLHCGCENSYIPFGPGVERIQEELEAKLPNAKIAIASSDTMSSGMSSEEFIKSIYNNEINIIIATQILAKGYHFPNITLVGVVDGDLGLFGADLRASEKTYQLINQVAGRAGRAEKKGKVIIQTFNPDNALFKIIHGGEHTDFFDHEIMIRKQSNSPPFCRLVSVIVSGTNRELTRCVADKTMKTLRLALPTSIQIFGPSPAVIAVLRGRARWRILLKSAKNISFQSNVQECIEKFAHHRNIKIQIDVDPISFL